MPLLADPYGQVELKARLNGDVADAVMLGHINRANRLFREALDLANISGIEDIPVDARPYELDLRKLFLEIRWNLVKEDINQLTEAEIENAKRLGIGYIMNKLPERTVPKTA